MSDYKKYYKTSEVARLFNVTIDALRYYEKIELLHPIRDLQNNYRYYTADDIRNMSFIKELLSLNFSLEDVHRFLDHRNVESTLYLFREEWNSINNSLVQLFQARDTLEARIRFIEKALHDIPIGTIRKEQFYERPCLRISNHDMDEDNITIALAEYSKQHNESIDTIGVCDCYTISVDALQKNQGVQISDIFYYSEHPNYKSNFSLPNGSYLCYAYRGPYEESEHCLYELINYAKNNNYTLLSDIYAIFMIDSTETSNPEECVVDLQLQVKK